METLLPHHLAARLAHETRWDRIAASRENYRTLAAVLLALVVFLCVLNWRLATQAQVYTYVVEVDRHGQPLYVGPASTKPLPEDQLWRWTLASFIGNLRTVPSDPEQLRIHLADAGAYLRGNALLNVKAYFERNNPFETAKTTTVSIDPKELVILRRTKRQWQIEWTELHADRSGQRFEERWQALVTTLHEPSHARDSDRTLQLLNPLGLFVTDLDWTLVNRRTL
jgi:type IV secretory pathway TrbF-like protein